jgi:DMSO/TMAO reductase YedYZ molybdopterin-dependent catalytic subunit
MSDGVISRGFQGRRRHDQSGRLPPGQYLTEGFPVLSAGPTPDTPLATWSFTIQEGDSELARWSWEAFMSLPSEEVTTDVHCVTKWSKFDTAWRGVSIDTLLASAEAYAPYVLAFCDGDYTTNLATEDLTDGKAWIVYEYDGMPLPPQHGGPARLLVPHLYFWKSAKWVRGLTLLNQDEPGFWESLGYHNRGDPWKEERYAGD